MRLGIISDIHLDINKDYNVLEEIVHQSNNQNIDHLLIAGDITNDYQSTIKAVDTMVSKLNMPLWFIPGNHDLYDIDQKYPSTKYIYEKLSNHPSCIINKDVNLGENIVLIGDIMWYDYSLADTEHYDISHIKTKTQGGRTWKDSQYISWGKEDEEIANMFLDKLEKRIIKNQEKTIITMSHMITHEYFLPLEYREDIGFFYAFFGSSKIGELFKKYKTSYNIMGHIHYRRILKEDGITFICSCLNYHREWQSNPINLKKEVRESLFILTI